MKKISLRRSLHNIRLKLFGLPRKEKKAIRKWAKTYEPLVRVVCTGVKKEDS